jgi:hypothetical protein
MTSLTKTWSSSGDIKAKYGGALSFTPNTMRQSQANGKVVYNNVVFAYASRDGLNLLHEAVNTLHKHEEGAK